MLTGPQHAMDGDQGGTTSWLGSMYLGALAAAAEMADLQGDSASAVRYRQILSNGKANQDKALFNGEYYIQVPDATPRQDYNTGCYIDQLLGQWWALQIDCGWIYPPEHVRSAMAALFKHNFRANFQGIQQIPRKFVDDDDAGMQQCTWPRGGRPGSHMKNEIRYADEVMSGFEYSAASHDDSGRTVEGAFHRAARRQPTATTGASARTDEMGIRIVGIQRQPVRR